MAIHKVIELRIWLTLQYQALLYKAGIFAIDLMIS
jgi:hypothetical protein